MKAWMIVCLSVAVLIGGCGTAETKPTGFLSDYSKLDRETDTRFQYLDEKVVAGYSSVIVEPVQVRMYSNPEAKGKLTQEQIHELTTYMQSKMFEAVKAAGVKIADQPGPGVARIRVALTNIEKTDAINILPQASLIHAGVGGASMEAEAVDSVTGKQFVAVMQSGMGSRIPFSNLGDITAAKTVIDGWTKVFQARLEKMRAR